MNIIKIENGSVVSVEPVAEGVTAILSDKAPRVGSLLEGGNFFAPGSAALVDAGVVTQVAIGQWAADKPTPASGQWIDAPRDVVAGFLYDGAAFTAPPPPRDVAGEVATHAIVLKVGVVNATRTDGLTDPVTPEGLAAIEKRYQNLAADISADLGLAAAGAGSAVDPSRVETLKTIKAGFEFFEAVDASAAAILAAGDAADPIETDARWPALPAA